MMQNYHQALRFSRIQELGKDTFTRVKWTILALLDIIEKAGRGYKRLLHSTQRRLQRWQPNILSFLEGKGIEPGSKTYRYTDDVLDVLTDVVRLSYYGSILVLLGPAYLTVITYEQAERMLRYILNSIGYDKFVD